MEENTYAMKWETDTTKPFQTSAVMAHFPDPLPVAVMTHDWEKLSFSGGRVISENPATTKPCREIERKEEERGGIKTLTRNYLQYGYAIWPKVWEQITIIAICNYEHPIWDLVPLWDFELYRNIQVISQDANHSSAKMRYKSSGTKINLHNSHGKGQATFQAELEPLSWDIRSKSHPGIIWFI